MIGRCSPLLNYFFRVLAIVTSGRTDERGKIERVPPLFLSFSLPFNVISFFSPPLFFSSGVLYLGWFSVSRQVARATIRSSRIIAFSNCRFLPYGGRRSVVSPFFVPVPVETSIEKGDFFFSSPPVETPLSPLLFPRGRGGGGGGGGGIRWWNSMADFNGLWKVKIREKLLLEATSPISRKLFSPTFPSASASTSFFFSPFLSLFPFPLCVSVFLFSSISEFLFSSLSFSLFFFFFFSRHLFSRNSKILYDLEEFFVPFLSLSLSLWSVFFQFIGLQSTRNLITLHALSYHQ